MALIDCPDCGKNISSDAPTCPGCGKPIKLMPLPNQTQDKQKCPHCGEQTVCKVRGLQGSGEVLFAVFLFFMGIIPGIIYYIVTESKPYCSNCGKRVET